MRDSPPSEPWSGPKKTHRLTVVFPPAWTSALQPVIMPAPPLQCRAPEPPRAPCWVPPPIKLYAHHCCCKRAEKFAGGTNVTMTQIKSSSETPPPLPNVSETKNVRRRIRLGGMDCTSRGNLLLTFLEKQLKTSWLETLEAVIDRADWNQNSFYRGARRGARRAKRHAKKEAAHRPIYHQTSDRRLSSDRDAHKVVPPRTYIKVCCCCSVT